MLSKLGTNDSFWDIKQQESAAAEHFRNEIDGLERAIALGKRMSALSHAAGYQEFTSAIKDVEAYDYTQLVAAKDPYETARQQGRVAALRDILAMVENNEQCLLELDSRRKMLEDQASAIFRPDGKANTGVNLDGIR